MPSWSAVTSRTAMPSNGPAAAAQPHRYLPFEQIGEMTRLEAEQNGASFYDLRLGPPGGTANSQTLRVTSKVSARITPVPPGEYLYFLDWVDSNGTRIETTTGLVLVDVLNGHSKPDVLKPLGSEHVPRRSSVETYILHPMRIYRIFHANNLQEPLRTISFPSSIVPQGLYLYGKQSSAGMGGKRAHSSADADVEPDKKRPRGQIDVIDLTRDSPEPARSRSSSPIADEEDNMLDLYARFVQKRAVECRRAAHILEAQLRHPNRNRAWMKSVYDRDVGRDVSDLVLDRSLDQ